MPVLCQLEETGWVGRSVWPGAGAGTGAGTLAFAPYRTGQHSTLDDDGHHPAIWEEKGLLVADGY